MLSDPWGTAWPGPSLTCLPWAGSPQSALWHWAGGLCPTVMGTAWSPISSTTFPLPWTLLWMVPAPEMPL